MSSLSLDAPGPRAEHVPRSHVAPGVNIDLNPTIGATVATFGVGSQRPNLWESTRLKLPRDLPQNQQTKPKKLAYSTSNFSFSLTTRATEMCELSFAINVRLLTQILTRLAQWA